MKSSLVVKFAKIYGGVGYHASVWIALSKSSNKNIELVDNCSWSVLRNSYPEFNLGPGLLKWKECVLKGMRYGLSLMSKDYSVEISLDDISGHVLHTNDKTMYVAGIISIFDSLKIELNNEDQESIDNYIKNSKHAQETNDFSELTLSNY